VGGVLNGIAKGTGNISEIHVVKEVNKATATFGRITTNHSLVTARLV
jgi:hypothetical protein